MPLVLGGNRALTLLAASLVLWDGICQRPLHQAAGSFPLRLHECLETVSKFLQQFSKYQSFMEKLIFFFKCINLSPVIQTRACSEQESLVEIHKA